MMEFWQLTAIMSEIRQISIHRILTEFLTIFHVKLQLIFYFSDVNFLDFRENSILVVFRRQNFFEKILLWSFDREKRSSIFLCPKNRLYFFCIFTKTPWRICLMKIETFFTKIGMEFWQVIVCFDFFRYKI